MWPDVEITARAMRANGTAPRTNATVCAPTGANRTTKRSTDASSTSTDIAITCGPKPLHHLLLKTSSRSPFRYLFKFIQKKIVKFMHVLAWKLSPVVLYH